MPHLIVYTINNKNIVGVKIHFDPMIPTSCSALRAPATLKHLKSAHFPTGNGCFSVFCGSQSHVSTCKHVIHGLLTLVSFYASSRICSDCGYQNVDTKDLSVRELVVTVININLGKNKEFSSLRYGRR